MKRLLTNPTAILLFFLGFWVLSACQKDVLTTKSNETDRHIVPEYFARTIAEKFDGNKFFRASADTPKIVGTGITEMPFIRPVKNSYTIPDKNKKPAFYIYNYADGGFVFVSAELLMWMDKTIENIEILRDGKYDNSKTGIAAWNDFIIKNQIELPDEIHTCLKSFAKKSEPNQMVPLEPQPDCDTWYTTQKGPFIPVTWGQGTSYNNLINPGIDYGCYQTGNDRPWTGCVATAMAQLIRYWKSTPIYDYNSMPNNQGNAEVQKLMYDAGKYVDMGWGCSGSNTSGSKILPALKTHFNFNSGDRIWNNANIYGSIITNLNNSWPVLLGGCSDKDCSTYIFFCVGVSCHEWICDGYKSAYSACAVGYTYLHMNWGWHETYCNSPNNFTDYNGWFAFHNWYIPGQGDNYQYFVDAIIDIHP